MTGIVPDGVDLIAQERARQVAEEGWTPEHDDAHIHGELVKAAVTYTYAFTERAPTQPPGNWPWAQRWWKPDDRVRNLVKAGALIAAEIDRLQRKIIRS